jgi:hypothetical protein
MFTNTATLTVAVAGYVDAVPLSSIHMRVARREMRWVCIYVCMYGMYAWYGLVCMYGLVCKYVCMYMYSCTSSMYETN